LLWENPCWGSITSKATCMRTGWPRALRRRSHLSR
jgi:hypothetical protein